MTSTATGLRTLITQLEKAAVDLKANAPLDPAAGPRGPGLVAALTAAQPKILAFVAEAQAAIQSYPGVILAIDDVLEAFRQKGCLWAAELEDALNAAPNLLGAINDWFPTIMFALAEIEPAARGIPGAWSGARGNITP